MSQYEGTVIRVGYFSITASRSVRNIGVFIAIHLCTNKHYPSVMYQSNQPHLVCVKDKGTRNQCHHHIRRQHRASAAKAQTGC